MNCISKCVCVQMCVRVRAWSYWLQQKFQTNLSSLLTVSRRNKARLIFPEPIGINSWRSGSNSQINPWKSSVILKMSGTESQPQNGDTSSTQPDSSFYPSFFPSLCSCLWRQNNYDSSEERWIFLLPQTVRRLVIASKKFCKRCLLCSALIPDCC